MVEILAWAFSINNIPKSISITIERFKILTLWISNTHWFFEVAGNKVESFDRWKPNNPDIIINQEVSNRDTPQAWSRILNIWWINNVIWYYNYPWAIAEAEYLWKRILTIKEWMDIFKIIPWDADKKAKILNMDLSWYRSASNNTFTWEDDCSSYWAIDEKSKFSSQWVYLWKWADWASRGYFNKWRWVTLRLAYK